MISKVYHNLEQSPYIVKLHNILYVFSSEINRDKFLNRVVSCEEDINHSLSCRFKIPIEVDAIGDIVAYMAIEHRGCRVILPNNDVITEYEQIGIESGELVCRYPRGIETV